MTVKHKSLFAGNIKNRVLIADKIFKKEISVSEGAERLQINKKYMYALLNKARTFGVQSLLVKAVRPGRKAVFTPEIKEHIINLYKKYAEQSINHRISRCSFALFREILGAVYKTKISYSALRTILTDGGITSPYSHRLRKRKKKMEYRVRKQAEGAIWLADGSPYNWLGGQGKQTIHIVQDDATGKLVGLYMCTNECFLGYAESFKMGIRKYGIPQSLVSDLASVFYVSRKLKENTSIAEQLKGVSSKKTQMGYILTGILGIQMIPTYSPESKGRVERVGQTLQKRLPFLFMLNNIKTIDEANKFLKTYIDIFNKQFAVHPAEPHSKYVPLNKDDDLNNIFSIRHTRRTDSLGVFSFYNYKFKVVSDSIPPRNAKVRIYLNAAWGMRVRFENKFYPVELLQLDKNKKALGGKQLSIPIVWKDLFDKYLFLDAKKESPLHLTG